jgi:chorismate dehydratase
MAQNVRMMPTVPLPLGWIPYWNLAPLKVEVERALGAEIEMQRGHPSQVNRLLEAGRVSIAPCSSICLIKNPGHEIAMPLGISTSGPVTSVYLGVGTDDQGTLELVRNRHAMLREVVRHALSRGELDARRAAATIFKLADQLPPLETELPPALVVTPASATSTCLARILYRLWFGETAYEAFASPAQAGLVRNTRHRLELVIGDEALQRRPQFRQILDLGDAWKDLTDLPFVFAVWQKGPRPIAPYWRQRISEAAELAQARMRVEPCHYLPDMPFLDVTGKPVDLPAYWKVLQYRLGPAHFQGLALFFALARCLAPAGVDDAALTSIMKWESLGAQMARI